MTGIRLTYVYGSGLLKTEVAGVLTGVQAEGKRRVSRIRKGRRSFVFIGLFPKEGLPRMICGGYSLVDTSLSYFELQWTKVI
jgi:hypothetical protein